MSVWVNKICTLNVDSFNKTTDHNPKCTGNESRFFAQVLWKVKNEEELKERKQIQFVLVWTTITSAILYFVGFEIIGSFSETKLAEYDKETTTCSDYTAIYKIPPQLFENFKQNTYSDFNRFLYQATGETQVLVMAFKMYLWDGIEKVLNNETTALNEYEIPWDDETVYNPDSPKEDLSRNSKVYPLTPEKVNEEDFMTPKKHSRITEEYKTRTDGNRKMSWIERERAFSNQKI